MSKRISALLLCLFLFCLLIVFPAAGCGQNSSSGSGEEPPVFSPLKVLVPEAPGTDTIGYSPLILDISNISQGYLTAVSDSNGTTKNIQLSADDGVVYSYFVSSGESAVIPFTSGSGTYQVSCYEQVNGSQYAALFAQALEVSLENEFLPFLYPNQYVNFTPDSEACKLALSLLAEDATEQESIDTVFQYVTQHVTYDEDKAATVETGYLPDIDETLSTGKGICFDYAALMTAMLRSSGIPTRLDIGYATNIYHAWISTYLEETGIFYEALQRAGVFPDYVIQMAKLGEETGNLDVTTKGLAAYYEREENTMQDIRSAISYPLMILCMLLTIMLVMIVKVMPVFNQVYEQLGSQITGPAAVLLKTGEVLKQYWVIPAVFICIFAAGVWWLLKTIKGNTVLRRLTGRFFSSKSIVKRLNSARISSALSKIAVQVDEEVTAEIQNFVSVIEPTMVIILSILVGALLLSVMMPLMGILSVIG